MTNQELKKVEKLAKSSRQIIKEIAQLMIDYNLRIQKELNDFKKGINK